ncbi:hypothetical protein DPMN_077335 [Dreissena polymorpha]|uniref:Uncharacterized protein n=1 Tax=Dreissena polymorpha TaxID=45954 RepID=A0A9D3YLQ8_DREPO|nr:hypothetical protein DPMN_077335 [Dreissena polymorpha]
MPNVDVRAGSIFASARYSGLVPNFDVRAGLIFALLNIQDKCRMSMSELARHSPKLDIRD